MRRTMKNKIVFAMLLLVFLSACTSTTLIQSTPPGAKVYINEEPAGYTPLRYADSKILFSSTNFRLEYEGYEPFYVTMIRDEEVDPGPVVAGFFTGGLSWLWALKYKPVRHFELNPLYYEEYHEEYYEENIEMAPEPVFYQDKIHLLRELKALLDDGIITTEEFEKEKKKLLDN